MGGAGGGWVPPTNGRGSFLGASISGRGEGNGPLIPLSKSAALKAISGDRTGVFHAFSTAHLALLIGDDSGATWAGGPYRIGSGGSFRSRKVRVCRGGEGGSGTGGNGRCGGGPASSRAYEFNSFIIP